MKLTFNGGHMDTGSGTSVFERLESIDVQTARNCIVIGINLERSGGMLKKQDFFELREAAQVD